MMEGPLTLHYKGAFPSIGTKIFQDKENFIKELIERSIQVNGKSNVHIRFFQNGVYIRDKESLSSLNSLWRDASLRITNVQNVNPFVRGMVHHLYKCFNKLTTCNMYIFQERDNFHLKMMTSIYEFFSLQLSGCRLWETSHRQVILKEGEILHMPLGQSHRSESNDEGPSIYLNFVFHLLDDIEIYNTVSCVVREKMKEKTDINGPMPSESLNGLFDDVRSVFLSHDVEKMVQDHERKQFDRSLQILRRGVMYGEKRLSLLF